jgi:hypothetical protein
MAADDHAGVPSISSSVCEHEGRIKFGHLTNFRAKCVGSREKIKPN